MKLAASVRFLVLISALILLAQVIFALLLDHENFILVNAFFVVFALILVALWLALRLHRTKTLFESKWEEACINAERATAEQKAHSETLREITHLVGKNIRSTREIVQLLELNTQELRRISQLNLEQAPSPMELRAKDDINFIRQELEKLRRETTMITSMQSQLSNYLNVEKTRRAGGNTWADENG